MGFVSLLNLAVNLFQVGRARPVELMRKPKKGERDARKKSLWLLAALGVTALSGGYYLSLSVPMNNMVFIYFLGAVLLVVIGTYLLFIWGSIVILRILKGNRRFFYRKENFITISGMYSRMKRSATSLVNICIFSTMVIITLMCTAAVALGNEGMLQRFWPHDLEFEFQTAEQAGECREAWTELAAGGSGAAADRAAGNGAAGSGAAADSTAGNGAAENAAAAMEQADGGVTVEELIAYRYFVINLAEQDGRFAYQAEEGREDQAYSLFRFVPLADFNANAGTAYELSPGEVMVFTTGENYGRGSITFENKEYQVKAELTEIPMEGKEQDYQIFMVFFIPLAMAVLYTAAGLPMTIKLLWAIQFRDVGLILGCGIAVIVAFGGLYYGCYVLTARAYLRIVRKMA